MTEDNFAVDTDDRTIGIESQIESQIEEPDKAEILETSRPDRKMLPKRCGACGDFGHNARTCRANKKAKAKSKLDAIPEPSLDPVLENNQQKTLQSLPEPKLDQIERQITIDELVTPLVTPVAAAIPERTERANQEPNQTPSAVDSRTTTSDNLTKIVETHISNETILPRERKTSDSTTAKFTCPNCGRMGTLVEALYKSGLQRQCIRCEHCYTRGDLDLIIKWGYVPATPDFGRWTKAY